MLHLACSVAAGDFQHGDRQMRVPVFFATILAVNQCVFLYQNIVLVLWKENMLIWTLYDPREAIALL
jgi:hypothetical protein